MRNANSINKTVAALNTEINHDSDFCFQVIERTWRHAPKHFELELVFRVERANSRI